MDFEEMQRFKVRAIEIGRKSRNPVKCLRLMQVKATSILGFDVFAGGRECFLPPKGAMVSSTEGIQAGKNWVSNEAAKAADAAILPAGVRFTAPGFDPGTPQIDPVADGPVVGMDLGATDNAIEVDSDVQGSSHFSATDDLGTQQNEVKSCSVLLCGIDEKLSSFHGSGDWVTGTNSVSISLNYTQSEETAEMDQNLAGKFKNMDRSQFYFDNIVLIEEEPDPGGMGTPRIGLAQRMEDANSMFPANQVNQEYVPIKQEKPELHKKQRLEESDDQQERKAQMNAGLPGQPGETQ